MGEETTAPGNLETVIQAKEGHLIYDRDRGVKLKNVRVILYPQQRPGSPNSEAHLDVDVEFDFTSYVGTKPLTKKVFMGDYKSDEEAKKAYDHFLYAFQVNMYNLYVSSYAEHCSLEILINPPKQKDSGDEHK